jgi:hypothetical protein
LSARPCSSCHCGPASAAATASSAR